MVEKSFSYKKLNFGFKDIVQTFNDFENKQKSV